MIGSSQVGSSTEIEYDSVTIHYTDAREPRVVGCVTDFGQSRHFRTGEKTLQILHKSCEGEARRTSALVIKPLELPVSDVDHLVLERDGEKTVVSPEELLD